MSDEELKAELERLRVSWCPHEGKRKGSTLDLRHGALSRDPV